MCIYLHICCALFQQSIDSIGGRLVVEVQYRVHIGDSEGMGVAEVWRRSAYMICGTVLRIL
jgi:hypothetical protein